MLRRDFEKFKSAPKAVKLTLGLSIMILFGDQILSLVGHFLHVVLEVIELALEHFLESTFDLGRKQAQIVVFWTGFSILSCLAWFGLKRLYATSCAYCLNLRQEAKQWQRSHRKPAWAFILALSGLGMTFFLFT